jgi:protein involved in polysaccharide export with SLBB domain
MDAVNLKRTGLLLIVLATVGMTAGCQKTTEAESFFKTGKYRFLSPDKPIAKPSQNELSWIIQSMGTMDKADELYPNATRPGPSDWVYSDTDYVIGATDVLGITVMDLYAEGLETTLQREVTESGFISLPLLDERIRAEGLTSLELTERIKQTYSEKGILRDPQVAISLLARRQQTFSILGAVLRPGTYNQTRPDMRLLDALALAGGIAQTNLDYLYVIRHAPAFRQSEVQDGAPLPAVEGADPSSPDAPANTPQQELQQVEGLMDSGMMGQVSFTETASGPATAPTTATGQTHRWVYRDGEWVRVPVGEVSTRPSRPQTTTRRRAATLPSRPGDMDDQPTTDSADDPFGWSKVEKKDLVRVIAINIPKLEQGDYRQNIVIRENDVIQVPGHEMGEFYIMGEVLRPGVYSLTGREVTIKMAMAAAGNLGPLAWPENSVLIRRVGKNQEQLIPINIEKIIRGEAPDIYLKKNDVIAVGTHWSSTFLAVLRNAFRMTYGFGFIYDRNFADPLLVYPDSKRFKGL